MKWNFSIEDRNWGKRIYSENKCLPKRTAKTRITQNFFFLLLSIKVSEEYIFGDKNYMSSQLRAKISVRIYVWKIVWTKRQSKTQHTWRAFGSNKFASEILLIIIVITVKRLSVNEKSWSHITNREQRKRKVYSSVQSFIYCKALRKVYNKKILYHLKPLINFHTFLSTIFCQFCALLSLTTVL